MTEVQPPDAEEEISLNTDEPASVAIIKLPRAGLIRPLMIVRFADWLHWIGKSLAIVNAMESSPIRFSYTQACTKLVTVIRTFSIGVYLTHMISFLSLRAPLIYPRVLGLVPLCLD